MPTNDEKCQLCGQGLWGGDCPHPMTCAHFAMTKAQGAYTMGIDLAADDQAERAMSALQAAKLHKAQRIAADLEAKHQAWLRAGVVDPLGDKANRILGPRTQREMAVMAQGAYPVPTPAPLTSTCPTCNITHPTGMCAHPLQPSSPPPPYPVAVPYQAPAPLKPLDELGEEAFLSKLRDLCRMAREAPELRQALPYPLRSVFDELSLLVV